MRASNAYPHVHALIPIFRPFLACVHYVPTRPLGRPHHRLNPIWRRHLLCVHVHVYVFGDRLPPDCGISHGEQQRAAVGVRGRISVVRRCDVWAVGYGGRNGVVGRLDDDHGTVAVRLVFPFESDRWADWILLSSFVFYRIGGRLRLRSKFTVH